MRAPVYGDFAAQQGLEDKADIDDAITEILVSTDEERRQELYTFVLTRLHEDAVYIPLTYECNKAIYRSDLQGFHFTQTQYEVPLLISILERRNKGKINETIYHKTNPIGNSASYYHFVCVFCVY